MPLFEIPMRVTEANEVFFTVEADSLEAAIEAAKRGETVNEEYGEYLGVIDREIGDETQICEVED